MLNLSCFPLSLSIDTPMSCLPFVQSSWPHVDLHLLNHPCKPRKDPILLWWVTLECATAFGLSVFWEGFLCLWSSENLACNFILSSCDGFFWRVWEGLMYCVIFKCGRSQEWSHLALGFCLMMDFLSLFQPLFVTDLFGSVFLHDLVLVGCKNVWNVSRDT